MNGRLQFIKYMLDKHKIKGVLSKFTSGMLPETKLPGALGVVKGRGG